jgi:hypothetical protein
MADRPLLLNPAAGNAVCASPKQPFVCHRATSARGFSPRVGYATRPNVQTQSMLRAVNVSAPVLRHARAVAPHTLSIARLRRCSRAD